MDKKEIQAYIDKKPEDNLHMFLRGRYNGFDYQYSDAINLYGLDKEGKFNLSFDMDRERLGPYESDKMVDRKTFELTYPINSHFKPLKVKYPSDDFYKSVSELSKKEFRDLYSEVYWRQDSTTRDKWAHWEFDRLIQNYKDLCEIKDINEQTFKETQSLVDFSSRHPAVKAEVIMTVNRLPEFFSPKYKFSFNPDQKILQVDFNFPDYAEEELYNGQTKTRYPEVKIASATLKKKLVKETLYSLIIWIGHVLAAHIDKNSVEKIAINTKQSWFDPATGSPTEGTIASVLADREYLAKLNIEKVDPIACFKQMKGLVTPSLEKQTSIRPIFEMNMDDSRLVDSKDVDGALEEGSNLAAMPWEDFEHLVAQLFEWQFAKDGTEVKVTQASRDRGVDAIVFDPDPFMGGKYVLQAKRYTNTVDVASVRDLYGTVMNEGANRGILITTSSYGPEAYDFAKDKPISLVDGPNLLNLLREHGKKYKIDLEEAKLLNKEE